MEFYILQANNRSDKIKWKMAWDQLPPECQDVYFLPEYILASEAEGLGKAMCALAISGDAVWLYPFLKSPVPSICELRSGKTLYDIQSAYGYGGPVVNKAGENTFFLETAWQHFHVWCCKENVVGEFCRFHPLIDNQRWAAQKMRVMEDRTTVSMDLCSYQDAVWKDSYFRIHRNMLRRAEREGYQFSSIPVADQMSWFVPLYAKTQDLLNAGNDTRFKDAYFETLAGMLSDRSWLGLVKQDDTILAAVLILDGVLFSHSHLMVYGEGPAASGMTNLLYHGVALEAARRKRLFLNMGGGKTTDEKDSLLRFKQSLSPVRQTFYIGTCCHDEKWYERLGTQWEKLHGSRPSGYFLFYRILN